MMSKDMGVAAQVPPLCGPSGEAPVGSSAKPAAANAGSDPNAGRDWEVIARREYLSAIEWSGRHQEALHYLCDLDAAVFLAAEYNPDLTIGEFFAASGAVKRSREYLFARQDLRAVPNGDAPQGGPDAS